MDSHSDDVLMLGFCLIIGIFIRFCRRSSKKLNYLPYSIYIFIIGILLGVWLHNGHMGLLFDGSSRLSQISPDTILFVLLPIIIFEPALFINKRITHHTIYQAIILAWPLVALNIIFFAVIVLYLFDYSWGWSEALLLASALSATDPTAILSILKESAISKRLSATIEYESLLNDGVAFAAFKTFLDNVEGLNRSGSEIFVHFIRLSLGGLVCGLVFGLGASFILHFIVFDDLSILMIMVVLPYITFWICEKTYLRVSGALAVVVAAITISHLALEQNLPRRSLENLSGSYHVLTWVSNTILFIILGLTTASEVFYNDGITGRDVANVFILYGFLNIARVIGIMGMLPLINRVGYHISYCSALFISFGGLRGTISITLALIVSASSSIDSLTRNRYLFVVTFVTMLTLLLNAPAIPLVLHWLQLNVISKERRVILDRIIKYARNWLEERINSLRSNPFYDGTNWEAIDNELRFDDIFSIFKTKSNGKGCHEFYTWMTKCCCSCNTCCCDNLNNGENLEPLPPDSLESSMEAERQQLRYVFFRALRRAYSSYLHQERSMSVEAYRILAMSTDLALDEHNPTCQWGTGIEKHCRLLSNRWSNFCRKLPFGNTLLSFFMTRKILLNLEVTINFVQAHREVKRLLLDPLDDQLKGPIIAEIDSAIVKALTSMRYVSMYSETITRAVQTRHALFVVITSLIGKVEEMSQRGLFDENEQNLIKMRLYQQTLNVRSGIRFENSMHNEEAILAGLFPFKSLSHHEVCNLIRLSERDFFEPGIEITTERGHFVHVVIHGMVLQTFREFARTFRSSDIIPKEDGQVEESTNLANDGDSSTDRGQANTEARRTLVRDITSRYGPLFANFDNDSQNPNIVEMEEICNDQGSSSNVVPETTEVRMPPMRSLLKYVGGTGTIAGLIECQTDLTDMATAHSATVVETIKLKKSILKALMATKPKFLQDTWYYIAWKMARIFLRRKLETLAKVHLNDIIISRMFINATIWSGDKDEPIFAADGAILMRGKALVISNETEMYSAPDIIPHGRLIPFPGSVAMVFAHTPHYSDLHKVFFAQKWESSPKKGVMCYVYQDRSVGLMPAGSHENYETN